MSVTRIRADYPVTNGSAVAPFSVVSLHPATDTVSVAIVRTDYVGSVDSYAVAVIDSASYRARTANVWSIVGGSMAIDLELAREIANIKWTAARNRV